MRVAAAAAEGRTASADRPGRSRRRLGPGPGHRRAEPVRRRRGAGRPARAWPRTSATRGKLLTAADDHARPDPRPVRPGHGQARRVRAELFLRHRHSACSSTPSRWPARWPRASSRRASPTGWPRRWPPCCRSGPATAMSSASTCGCGPTRPRPRPSSPCPWRSTTTRASARTGSGRPSSRPAPCCGDLGAAAEFLKELRPFIWRRSLDYPAMLDIQSIKRQIHVHKTGEGLERGGRQPEAGARRHPRDRILRPDPAADPGRPRPGAAQSRAPWTPWPPCASRATCPPRSPRELTDAYVELRGARAPGADARRRADPHPARPIRRAARRSRPWRARAIWPPSTPASRPLLIGVNRRYGELFEGEEDAVLALRQPGLHRRRERSRDPGDPGADGLLRARRAWPTPSAAGTTAASPRPGRRGAASCSPAWRPRLLTALAGTGAADAAFRRFAVFFAGLIGRGAGPGPVPGPARSCSS